VIRVVALAWTIRLAGETFKPEVLGLLLLTRRISSTLANLFQLGTSQTLLRHISMNEDNPSRKRVYVLFSAAVWGFLLVACVPIAYSACSSLMRWWFPEADADSSLALWTTVLAFSMVAEFITASTFMAERWVALSNGLEVFNTSGYLLILLLIQGRSATVVGVTKLQALISISVSVVAMVAYCTRLRTASWPKREDRREILLDFVQYGLPRGGMTFLNMSVLLIGPWLLREDLEVAGFLIIALTVVTAVRTSLMPLAQIALVVTARKVAKKDEASIRAGIRMMLGIALYGGILLVVLLMPWASKLLMLWLGDATLVEGVRGFFVVICWAVPPLALFAGLRGIIEARWVMPLNLFTLAATLCTQVVLYFVLVPSLGEVQAICVSMLAMFYVMGILTVFWVRRDLPSLGYWGLLQLGAAAAVIALVNLWAASEGSAWSAVVAAVGSMAMLGLLVKVFPSEFIRQAWPWGKHRLEPAGE
jgi:Na+-driven multidrug efflux pump